MAKETATNTPTTCVARLGSTIPSEWRLKTLLKGFVVLVLFVSLFGAIVAGTRYLNAIGYFDIKYVYVTGQGDKVSASLVEKTVRRHLKENIFAQSLNEIREDLEVIPWVKTAWIRRVWPNAVSVQMLIYRAQAVYEDGRLVNQEGELFKANKGEVQALSDLPRFFAPVNRIAEVSRLYEQLKVIVGMIDAQIIELKLSDRGSWSLVIAGEKIPPTHVMLGRFDSVEKLFAKLTQLLGVYPDVVKNLKKAPKKIDMRYKDAFAVSM